MTKTEHDRSPAFSKYSTTHIVEQALVRGFLRTFDDAVPDIEPRTVLEVGVGEGMIAQRVRDRFPEALVVVLDLPDPQLANAWRNRGLRGVFADASHLPFRHRSVDLVVGIEVLEHLVDPFQALSEMARVCRSHAVLSVPLEPLWRVGNMLRGRYWARLGNTPDHLQHWTRRRFRSFVSLRFRIERMLRPFPWTLVVARAPDDLLDSPSEQSTQ